MKQLRMLFMLFCFLNLAVTAAAETAGAIPVAGQEAFQEAMHFRANGLLLEAENKMLEALQVNPGNPDFHFELANIYAARYDQWSKTPFHPAAQDLLNQAVYQLEQAVMIRPDNIPPLFNLGIVYKKRAEYENARAQFQKVLELDPKSVASWMQIGAIYESQGFFHEAYDAYQKAREIDYYNPEINSAIQDLKDTEATYVEERRQRDARQYGLAREFSYAAFSQARNLPRGGPTEEMQSGGAVQAVPYLAAMLVQQFMTLRQKTPQE